MVKAHPGVKVVSRDRSKNLVFAAGAPEAIHVADRFHLLQNLAETLNSVFSSHNQALKAVDEAFSASVIQTDGTRVVESHDRAARRKRCGSRTKPCQEACCLSAGLGLAPLGLQSQSAHNSGLTSVFAISVLPPFRTQGRRSRGQSIVSPYQKYLRRALE